MDRPVLEVEVGCTCYGDGANDNQGENRDVTGGFLLIFASQYRDKYSQGKLNVTGCHFLVLRPPDTQEPWLQSQKELREN